MKVPVTTVVVAGTFCFAGPGQVPGQVLGQVPGRVVGGAVFAEWGRAEENGCDLR